MSSKSIQWGILYKNLLEKNVNSGKAVGGDVALG